MKEINRVKDSRTEKAGHTSETEGSPAQLEWSGQKRNELELLPWERTGDFILFNRQKRPNKMLFIFRCEKSLAILEHGLEKSKSGSNMGLPWQSVVMTPHFHCREHMFNFWSNN